MANFLVGDVHGCYDELMLLLEKADFNPEQDTLWLTGDLVSRGKNSLAVLRFAKSLGNQLKMVLGNHDLHLLAVYAGIGKNKSKDNLQQVIDAHDCDELINWLRRQPVLQIDDSLKLIMSHAGISPQWDLNTLQKSAHDLQAILSSDSYAFFLNSMYGDLPDSWSDNLQGVERLRYIANALTRMRYCYADGRLDMYCKDSPKNAPAKLKPWYMLPSRLPPEYSIAFGHWASLNGKGTPENIYALDTGCCWGGRLTGLRWEDKARFRKRALDR